MITKRALRIQHRDSEARRVRRRICPNGKEVRKKAHRFHCRACSKQMLHHPVTSNCGCSFMREGVVVCRDCAIDYDVVMGGPRRIAVPEEKDFTADEVKTVRRMLRHVDTIRQAARLNLS